MSLKHAILGLLTIQPMTGYDLKHAAFDTSIAHFWRADQAQIYRALDKMAGDGWVESTVEVQTERPNRRVYHITDAGRAELLNWLESPQPPPVYREPFLVQVFFAYMLPEAQTLAHMQDHIAAHRETLARYEALAPGLAHSPGSARQKQFWQMTLDLGMALEHTYLEWLARCQAAIAAVADNDSA